MAISSLIRTPSRKRRQTASSISLTTVWPSFSPGTPSIQDITAAFLLIAMKSGALTSTPSIKYPTARLYIPYIAILVPRMPFIFPTKMVFVMPLDDVLYGDRLIASAQFQALKSFLIHTIYQTIVRHLVIITRLLQERICPYILLNALWPCLQRMKDLEKVDLDLGKAGVWHNICKESWLIPELEKGPKIQYITWWDWKPPNGQNTCKGGNKCKGKYEEFKNKIKLIKVLELIVSGDEIMDPKGLSNLSELIAELKLRINELRWNLSPILGAI